jgi:uncharacterized SAM-binding protein YcdF (DUF218 family)
MYAFFSQLADGFLLLMLALGVGLFVRWWRADGGRRLPGWLLLVYLLLWLFCMPLTAQYAAAWLEDGYPPLEERPAEAQAIVVLGAGTIPPTDIDSQTRLTESGLRRCLRAAELYLQGHPCPVLVSGGKVDPSRPGTTEAEALRELLIRLRVRPQDIVLESASTNTCGNAVESSKLLRDRQLQRVVLVTDATHLPRATRLFAAQGLTVFSAAGHYFSSELQWDWFVWLPDLRAAQINSAVFHECLGEVWGRLRGTGG